MSDTFVDPGTSAESEAFAAANRYGRFSSDGREYLIFDSQTPRPWVNIISNPRFGLSVSQTGSGFTWIDNSQLAVLTRWEQEFTRDCSGRFLYVRDLADNRLWSLAPAPTWPAYDRYCCRHGLGYTRFETALGRIEATWTLFADPKDTVELWRVDLRNTGDASRRLELTGFVEWCCGVAPSPRREFHKLFLETRYDPQRRAIFARSHMWEAVHTARWGHWNADFPYVCAFACSEPVLSAQGDKAAFLGRYGDHRAPEALSQELWTPLFGRHHDAIAALRVPIELRPGKTQSLVFVLAAGESDDELERMLDAHCGSEAIGRADRTLDAARATWRDLLAPTRVETPESTINYLTNDWVRYQAISARIWGRAGYYQQSGAFGFRDQLQDSQIWLPIEPRRCREQINLHAGRQFADGSVYHWWHPLTEQGHITKMTDDLLWLGFVTANYVRETGDLSVLDDAAPYLDSPEPRPITDHVSRAFERVFKRTSPRGIPYIGAGDWNDGLSAVGLQEKGESFWLAMFLAGLLADWAEIQERRGDGDRAADFRARRQRLVDAINTHGWDGQWYVRATLDDGRKLGSRENRVGRIFLNAQTWAVLNDIAPPERAARCMASVREHLVSPAGALLLAPAFDEPMQEVGYITRYAPGLRENGGVYSHAATWAIAAAARMRDRKLVGQLLAAMNPARKDPDKYWAEPYVLPGNVDGPDSPLHGRAGWTWYTGSAAWFQRVLTQWVLGVRPEWDGLRVDPCLPPEWNRASMNRLYRRATYRIRIERDASLSPSTPTAVTLDGRPLEGTLLPPPRTASEVHDVAVRVIS